LGGTREAYRNWALSVSGVMAASVLDDFPFGPGTVGVVVLGANGVPTPALLNEVHQYIKARKPLTADVRVLAPRIVDINIALEVTRFADADRGRIETDVRASLADYSRRLQLGEGLIIARLIDVVMDVEGIYNVKVLAPTRDVTIGVDGFLVISELSLIHRIKGRSYQDSGIVAATGDELTAGAQILAVDKGSFGLE
jgi:phage-related baseplate assembly protein